MERLKKEEEEKLKEVEAEQAAAAEEEEIPLQRNVRRTGEGESSGTTEEEKLEKMASEWVANLCLGEDEEAMMYIPQDERDAAIVEIQAVQDPFQRQALEEEKRMEWKLRLRRQRRRRIGVATELEEELAATRERHAHLVEHADLKNKVEIIGKSLEVMIRAQQEQMNYLRGHNIALQSMRVGFRDFPDDMMMRMGTEMQAGLINMERFYKGAIEGVKIAAPKEEEARPVKVKFPDSYSGKKEENFDNWEASVNSYVHLQKILPEEQVLVTFHALKNKAASFARSLARAAKCENDMVAYSIITPLSEFFRLLRERFADVTRGIRASDKLQTIHSPQWWSARALKGVMDELVAIPGHGVTEAQLVQLFYRVMPESLRGHFFERSRESAITYDTLSREVVAFEAQSMPPSTIWHKDLDKGKKWKGRTISGQVKAKDHLILTLDEGGMEEVPYSQIEWGLEEEDNSVSQGRTYAAITAGGRPQGRGGGQDQGAGPLVAEGRALRGLAAKETAMVPRKTVRIVVGHLPRGVDGTLVGHKASLGKIWVSNSQYGRGE
ncbi:hypothetical protein CBR_g37774 [Chara braunii]|uniref:Uncharacterized protein n=1 Tax=Chara braunii TaxID=69332 RepID=A0A388LNW1_CHABU|nr:hypothetical protein CBR_g37774 [Chara braunii]|eukprot:GBG83903.1 hypothetical protein CBR_g37774 [Chara braunii]